MKKDEDIEFKDGTMERGLHIDHLTLFEKIKEIQKDIDIILLRIEGIQETLCHNLPESPVELEKYERKLRQMEEPRQ